MSIKRPILDPGIANTNSVNRTESIKLEFQFLNLIIGGN